jgi:hypothetical protein
MGSRDGGMKPQSAWEMACRSSPPRVLGLMCTGEVTLPDNLPLAAQRYVGHIRLTGDVAEWLKAAVC